MRFKLMNKIINRAKLTKFRKRKYKTYRYAEESTYIESIICISIVVKVS